MARLPLEGIRIADLTVVWAGPFATQFLADWGAEVIRVESLQHWQQLTRGPIARPPKELMAKEQIVPWVGGYVDRDPGERPWNRHPYFNAHARNKLCMTVDMTKPKGKDMFKRLVEVSDIVFENNSPEVTEKWGFTYEELVKIKPDIIVVNMPCLGLSGPYKYYRMRGFELECLCGHTLLRGYPGLDPTTIADVYHCDAASGACAALATVMALRHRRKTGRGQRIEIPQAETLIPQLGQAIMDCTLNRRVQQTMGNRDPSAIQGCYRCKGEENWVNITIASDEEWQGFCRALGNPQWTKEERFGDALSRYQNHDELDKLIEEWTRENDHYAIMFLLQKEGVPAGAVMSSRDCFNDPHLKERGFFEPLTQVDSGTHLYPGLAWKASKTQNRLRLPPVRLGEHNEYVYKQVIGVSDAAYEELEKEGHIGMDYVPEIF